MVIPSQGFDHFERGMGEFLQSYADMSIPFDFTSPRRPEEVMPRLTAGSVLAGLVSGAYRVAFSLEGLRNGEGNLRLRQSGPPYEEAGDFRYQLYT